MSNSKRSQDKPRRRRGSSVTLHDVAARAGVHPMTVSNALKGTGRMSEATRESIRSIALELNYKPNLSARALVTGRTGTIAVMTGPVSEHFYAHVLHLLEDELAASEMQMVWMRARHPEQELSFLLQSGVVDGIIAVDAFSELSALAKSSASILPCVYAGVLHPELAPQLGMDSIAIDLSDAVRDAVRSLLGQGCRRVAYLVSNADMGHPEEVRARVYLEVMKETDHPTEIINLEVGSDTSHRAEVRLRLIEHVQKHGAPDGLLCQNDEMAIAAYRALLDLGLRVPEDVRLIGCDGLDDMDYFEPPLATLAQPAQQMCALAWEFLQRRLREPAIPLQRAVLKAQLRNRPSLAR